MTNASIHGSPAHGSRITEMPRRVVEQVRAEHERRARRRPRPGPRRPSVRKRYSTPSPANRMIVPSQRRCATQSGTPSAVEDPVERAHREQVADVLVGDRPEADVRVPHRPRPLEQPARVEVEVLLRVGGDLARRGQQDRDVREQRERERTRCRAACAADARSSARREIAGHGRAQAAARLARAAAVTGGGAGASPRPRAPRASRGRSPPR